MWLNICTDLPVGLTGATAAAAAATATAVAVAGANPAPGVQPVPCSVAPQLATSSHLLSSIAGNVLGGPAGGALGGFPVASLSAADPGRWVDCPA